MSDETPSSTSNQEPLQIYQYRKNALLPKVGLLIIWTVCFLLPFAMSKYPFLHEHDQRTLVFLVCITVIPNLYFHYLASVVRTAIFTLDQSFFGYQDCYVRGSAPWSKIVALTPKHLQLEDGKKIYFKLGLGSINNWQQLVEMVCQQSNLQPLQTPGRAIHIWKRSEDLSHVSG